MSRGVSHCVRIAPRSLPAPKEWHDIDGGHFGLVWHPSELFDEVTRVQREFLLKVP
jgi:hypothetical protein